MWRCAQVYKGNLSKFVEAVPEAQSYYALEATEQVGCVGVSRCSRVLRGSWGCWQQQHAAGASSTEQWLQQHAAGASSWMLAATCSLQAGN